MATNPESFDDQPQGFIRRAAKVISETTTSRSWRRGASIVLAAAFASLAPQPFGQIGAALVALIALESR